MPMNPSEIMLDTIYESVQHTPRLAPVINVYYKHQITNSIVPELCPHTSVHKTGEKITPCVDYVLFLSKQD
jgi:hypothetical protein